MEAKADFKKCGVGKGADCCIFFGTSAIGAECLRFGSCHQALIARKAQMNAQREPTEPFPGCQLGVNHA